MNNPRLKPVCLVIAAVVSLLACKDGGTSEPSVASGGAGTTNSGPTGTGGITSSGGAASSGGATGSGGVTSSGGATSSIVTGTGGKASGGISLVGGSTGGATGEGGATSTGGGGSVAGLTIYYIRHAEVIANTVEPSEITLENADALTDLGIRQVEALTTYLQGLGVTPDAILVSPHLRTQRTIGPYLVAKNLPGEIWMELAEASSATSTGAAVPTAPKYIKYYKATIEVPSLVFRDPAHIEFWQNDNYESGLLMVMTSRDLLLERYSKSGKTIFVVGHAIAGQMLIGLLRGDNLLGGPPTTGSSAVYIYNTGVMKVVQDATTGLFKLDGRNINNPATK
jgi:broad specificity phosphatase PhoE